MPKAVMVMCIVVAAVIVDANAQGTRLRIGVLNLENLGQDAPAAVQATAKLVQLLGVSGAAEIFDQARIEKELDRVGSKIPSSCHDPRCVMNVGGMINLDQMIFGSVDITGKKCGVHVYLLDLQVRQTIGEASIQGDSGEPIDSVLVSAIAVLHGLKPQGKKKVVSYDGPVVHHEKEMLISSSAFIGAGLVWGIVNYAKLKGSATLTPESRSEDLSGIVSSATNIAMFARPAALANAYVAASDDAYGVLYNPAGMAWVQHREAALGYQYRFGSLNNFAASYVDKATRDIGFGQAILYSGDPDNLMTEMYFVSAASYRINHLLSFTRPMAFGASLKVISESVNGKIDPADALSASSVSGGSFGAGLDLGFMAELSENIRYGLLLKDIPIINEWNNVSTGEKYNESSAMTLHMGGSYQVGYTTFLLAEGQIPILLDQSWIMSGGIEQEMFEVMYLRLGIQKEIQSYRDTDWKFTCGWGLKAGPVCLDASYEYNTQFYAGSVSDALQYPVVNVSARVAF